MRITAVATLLTTLFVCAPAGAQEKACHPISPTDRVTVTTTDGASISGTLLCLSDQAAAVLARDGQLLETPLAQIRRIQTRPDSVWDGALKGAAIPLILWTVFCHGCDGAAEPLMRAAGAYGLVGLTWDYLQSNQKTIYSGSARRSPSLAWRVRF
jgi:hypothetical protein